MTPSASLSLCLSPLLLPRSRTEKCFWGKKSGTFTRNQQRLEEQSFLTGRMGTFTPPQHHRDRDREESGPSWTRPTTPGHLYGGASAQLGLFKVHPKVNECTRAKVSAGALQLRPVLIGRVQNLLLVPGRRFPVLVLLGEDGKQKGWGRFPGVTASLACWRHHFYFLRIQKLSRYRWYFCWTDSIFRHKDLTETLREELEQCQWIYIVFPT